MKEPQCFSRFDYEFKVVQKLVELENMCSKLQEENEKLQQDVLRLKIENSELPDSSTVNNPKPTVAFLGVLNTQRLSVEDRQTVVFDAVVTNVGNAFNAADGVFTATYGGLYQFSTTVMADNNGQIWCDFLLNGVPVARIYARASDSRHDQGSHTIILQLKKGDSVCVRNLHKTTIYGEKYSSFSGVLLEASSG